MFVAEFRIWGFPKKTSSVSMETRLFGTACFVVALLGVTHFVAGPFSSRYFWRKFHENNCFLSIYIIFSVFCIFSFFFKTVEDFCLFLINFFPLYIKKYKFKHTATVFYSVIPGIDKIHSI